MVADPCAGRTSVPRAAGERDRGRVPPSDARGGDDPADRDRTLHAYFREVRHPPLTAAEEVVLAKEIEALPDLGSFGNVSYIVRPRDGAPATVIDAPEGVEAVLDSLAGREIGAVIVTHYHSDHWRGFETLRAASAAPVYAGADEVEIDAERGALRLADGQTLEVGGVPIEVNATCSWIGVSE